ncbi:MAG: FTR1 family protein [Leptonema sp. (in: Bacteria)]|nr:FTR1 family protein [Leptonema sp. (in: bacteria)]
MKLKVVRLTSFLVAILITFPLKAISPTDKQIAETVIHLLSYIAMDYSNSVQNGKIIDEGEYQEQVEFSQQAITLTNESQFASNQNKQDIIQNLTLLSLLINQKKTESEITDLAHRINDTIILIAKIETAPKTWPSLSNGESLYQKNCVSCHGQKGFGDGVAGKTLEPPPSNFHDTDLINNFSAYQAYNSIRLGVSGTGMQAYSSQFTENEIWDLAFYVKSIPYQNQKANLTKEEFQNLFTDIDLKSVATLSEIKLKQKITSTPLLAASNRDDQIIELRNYQAADNEKSNSLPIAKKGLALALEHYQLGQKKLARTNAIAAYLEGIEPVEARLRTIDNSFVAKIEAQMFQVRQTIEKDKDSKILEQEIQKAFELISEADHLLQEQHLSYWLTFTLAFSIMLREGMEAFLILFILIAIIRASNVKRALPWLHGGWVMALLCGVAGWFLADYIIRFGAKNREVMEGLISLFAVAVLVYVGYWMHSHSEAKKWQEFIKERIEKHLMAEKMFGLASFSFIVVFREVFEVILFLQAIHLEATDTSKSAIGIGVLVAFCLILVIAYFLLKTSKKVPIRQLFQYSTWFIVLLAIILMGKGIHSLQESGWASAHNFFMNLRFEWLGVYPTYEAILAQLGLIGVIVVAFFIKRTEKKLSSKDQFV